MNFNLKNEINQLRKMVALGKGGGTPHLDSYLGVFRYVRDADQIKKYLPNGKILDWGCGIGQMSYLLKNRGLDVISYDINSEGREFLNRIGQKLILANHQIKLPFSDASFDAVLSSGVLEHVTDPAASLNEIGRVLKKNGYLFIFRLPNKYSYIEFVSDCLGRGDHPVKYTKGEIKRILEQAGYKIFSVNYNGFIPYNLKGFHAVIRQSYHFFGFLLEMIDAVLAFLLIVNIFSTNIEVVARKK